MAQDRSFAQGKALRRRRGGGELGRKIAQGVDGPTAEGQSPGPHQEEVAQASQKPERDSLDGAVVLGTALSREGCARELKRRGRGGLVQKGQG